MEPLHFTGALGDLRSEEEQTKDFAHEEIASATKLEWKEKKEWKTYSVKRQYYTSQCVGHSLAKHLAINNLIETGKYEDLSGEFPYSFRANKPGHGMMWDDSMNIGTTKGSCKMNRIVQRIRDTEPETEITEEMIKEAAEKAGKLYFSVKGEITMKVIAEIIERQGSCILWVWFDVEGKEWWRVTPKIKYQDLATYDDDATRHAIVAVDYGLKDGEKVIIIEDSAGNNSAEDDQRRYLNKNFIKRIFKAGYIIDKPNPKPKEEREKPKYIFTRILKVGSRGKDVQALQKILIYEGFLALPNGPTEYFGGLTRSALIKWQEAHSDRVLKPWGLSKGTGVFAMKSIEYANEIYG